MKKSVLDELIVDLDGAAHLVRRRTAETLDGLSGIKGNKWILSDFGGASARLLTVEAPIRYAEIVAQRRLLEAGDAGEHARILTHWKRARGKTTTDIFCTVVEGDRFAAYEDRAIEDGEHHLLFPVHALHHACLREYAKKSTVLVMFEHDRHVDLLLGRAGQILAVSQASLYANTPEARENLADTVGQELRAMLADIPGKLELIVHYGWQFGVETETASATGNSSSTGGSGFSSFGMATKEASTSTGWAATGESTSMGKEQARLMSAEWAHKLAKANDVPLKLLKPRMLEIKGQEFVVTGIPEAVSALQVADSASPTMDRLQYRAQRTLSIATFLALLVVAGLYLGAIWLQRQTILLADEAMKLTNIGAVEALKVEPLDPVIQKAVHFADNLSRLKVAPSLQGIMADLSASMRGKMLLDQLVIGFSDQAKASLSLKGRIKAGFQQASQEHEGFVANLISKNYKVVKSSFTTDVMALTFNLQLERE
ncbi:MAG: hypothetical protein HQL96_11170 [Magnetococcales bacterium]|nr:hypothetical protein [Magnetococcales bacterium]